MILNETMILIRKQDLQEPAVFLSTELHYSESGFAVNFQFLTVKSSCP
jgi:hypothetical protein